MKKEILETIEEDFKVREEFINSQADPNIYGWLCPIHLVLVGKDHSKCPLCEHDKEVRSSGLLVGTLTPEDILKGKEAKRIKDREYMRKKLKDPKLKEKHYEAVNKYQQKEKARKKGHTIGLDS